MPRRTIRSIRVPTATSCDAVYPKSGTHTTIGLLLNREQAISLARLLLIASQDWEQVLVTAWRLDRPDGTFEVTVTTVTDDE